MSIASSRRPAEITVQDGRRELDEQHVLDLAANIAELGLLNPITIDRGNVLVAGRHRLEAVRKLGWVTVPVVVVDYENPLQTEWAEIVENILRKNLRWDEDAVAVARAKAIYEELHPETKHGSDGFRGNQHAQASSQNENSPPAERFTVAMSKATGVGSSTIARKAALGKALQERPELAKLPNEAAAIREMKREHVKANLESVAAKEAKAVEGVYDVLVIDPPWPMERIERDERPNQVAFDYPTMTEEELAALHLPAANDCHVWLWTTHKFMPMAFRLLNQWGLKYVCAFVWHKPGGFQPVGLPQYNCEFALYARKGSPVFLETKALPTCFNAPRGSHSEKPEAFYDMVRRVTAGRRLDMFSRRCIDGFDGWGKEAAE